MEDYGNWKSWTNYETVLSQCCSWAYYKYSSSRSSVVLQDAFLGRSKDHLDQIDIGILLSLAVVSFGGGEVSTVCNLSERRSCGKTYCECVTESALPSEVARKEKGV